MEERRGLPPVEEEREARVLSRESGTERLEEDVGGEEGSAGGGSRGETRGIVGEVEARPRVGRGGDLDCVGDP
jgi:hypothetical protein